MQNYAGMVWQPYFSHFILNILGLGAYFQNQFLRWNLEFEPVDLNTINPIIRMNFVFTYKRGENHFEGCQRAELEIVVELGNLVPRKKFVRIIGFMVFKSIGSDSQLQRKNWFRKICNESWDIGQNLSNFAGLVWKADFRQSFCNILELSPYFLKLWVRAGRFENHEP